jgi:hypothetical protein
VELSTQLQQIERHFLAKLPEETHHHRHQEVVNTLNSLCMGWTSATTFLKGCGCHNLKVQPQVCGAPLTSPKKRPRCIPFMCVDRLADLMMTAGKGSKRYYPLGPAARAIGIHLIGHQRPSVNVITGIIGPTSPAGFPLR